MRLPATGIVAVTGTPGSGKGYWCVREIVRVVLRERRPVYTNMPINIRTVRAYIRLKGGSRRLANLVRPLTKEHFERFTNRLAAIDQRAQELLEASTDDRAGEISEFAISKARDEAQAELDHSSPPILFNSAAGRANWIPPTSVIVMDELHKWYGSRSYRDEPQAILDYTSMHRHMLHRCYIQTQRGMNMSMSFRSMTTQWVFCHEYSKQPIVGFLKFPWIAFKYRTFDNHDTKDGEPRFGASPTDSELEIPRASGCVIYRLYQSHSHAGSLEALLAEGRDAAEMMMGDESNDEPRSAQESEEPMVRWALRICVVLVAFLLGRATSTGHAVDRAIAEIERHKAEVVEVASKSAEIKRQPLAGVHIQSVAASGVMIDGELIRPGGTYQGMLLYGVDPEAGYCAFLGDGELVLLTIDGRRLRRPLEQGRRGGASPGGSGASVGASGASDLPDAD